MEERNLYELEIYDNDGGFGISYYMFITETEAQLIEFLSEKSEKTDFYVRKVLSDNKIYNPQGFNYKIPETIKYFEQG